MNKEDIENELKNLDRVIWQIHDAEREFMRGKHWVNLFDRFKNLCRLMNFKKVSDAWNDYQIVLDVKEEKCPYCQTDLLVGEEK